MALETKQIVDGGRRRSRKSGSARHRLSPGRRQYLHFKAKYADSLLLFRMGDFYECFDEDAHTLSKLLDVALTARDVGGGQRSALAGIPYHALDTYLGRLVGAGLKVAIAEQTTNKPNSQGIVDRAVVRIVTPGTTLDASLLEQAKHNYLAACVVEGDRGGLAWLEASTGEFAALETDTRSLIEEVERLEPVEILVDASAHQIISTRVDSDAARETSLGSTILRQLDETVLDPDIASEQLMQHFETDALTPFNLEGCHLATMAAASALDYLAQTQIGRLPFITTLRRHRPDRYMHLSQSAMRDLEILAPSIEGGPTLLSTLDRTRTPMGARLLRGWVSAPLTDLQELRMRQDALYKLQVDSTLRTQIGDLLTSVSDVPRLVNRLTIGSADPRQLRALLRGLDNAPSLRNLVSGSDDDGPVSPLFEGIASHEEVRILIQDAIVEDPPVRISDGGVIEDGFDRELDSVRVLASDARQGIAEIEEKARESSGIRNLKVGHNKVFGYYIEVSKSNLHLVPEEFQRRQTLVNGERFITPELKELESKVFRAAERISELEQSIYNRVCMQIAAHAGALMRTATAIAHLDVCVALANVAVEKDWIMPHLDMGETLTIEDGRHPVVEDVLGAGRFVPNDLASSNHENQLLIVTGPNMSGKSTYIRQAAILVILAQIGSYVPAKSARIGIVDQIFTRIGISDDIAGGRSTFMVEMVETASILNQATPRSLAILDEIGRGTSTYDGLAIARAVAEFIHSNPSLGCKTLFATHYHEMTALGDVLPRAQNLRVAVAEEGEDIAFLYRIVPGGADRSYGVHVAMLAGMPSPVVERARELLSELEAQSSSNIGTGNPTPTNQLQLGFFENGKDLEFIRKVADLDVDNMSPIESLNKLYELRNEARLETEE